MLKFRGLFLTNLAVTWEIYEHISWLCAHQRLPSFLPSDLLLKPCTRSAHTQSHAGLSLNSRKAPEASVPAACPHSHHPPQTFQPSNLYNALCLHSKIRPSVPDKNRGFSNGCGEERCGPFTTFVAPLFVNFQFYLLTFLTPPHSTCCSTADKPKSDITSAFNI